MGIFKTKYKNWDELRVAVKKDKVTELKKKIPSLKNKKSGEIGSAEWLTEETFYQ